MAAHDAIAAVELAAGLLGDPVAERRLAAVCLLREARLSTAYAGLTRALSDADL